MEHGEELWLGAPQTPFTPVLPGPGAEPQRKLLTINCALRTIGQGDGTVSHPILSVLTLHPGDLTDYGRQLALAAAMAIQ